MKNSILITISVLVLSVITSCKKAPLSPTLSVVAKWDLVTDSTYVDYSAGTDDTVGNTYMGTTGDYFNFTANGKLYVHEGNVLTDTATYTIANDKLINMVYSFYNAPVLASAHITGYYNINKLTDTELVLSYNVLTQGGIFGKIITLEKNYSYIKPIH